ncbi:Pantetheinase [Armadillidium nasatum]|uniref:Pantetheinase n=1 Tax=Armadillidium nasatum TaxID=96803 RepID=A0A5N5SLM0_9CRUS|nr:Pantetheinase [Armadillidium nasatum]
MKGFLFLSLFLLISYSFTGNTEEIYQETLTYVGAVLEYEPYRVWTDEEQGYGVVRTNAEAVSSAAKMAKLQQAEILVAPEAGIAGHIDHTENLTRLLTYTTYVPNPWDSVVACNSSESHPNIAGLQILSCTAKQESIYIVVNMAEAEPCTAETISSAPWSQYNSYEPDDNCPEGGFYIRNTEVVIDRNGAVIARYRKIHLFDEDFFTPGPINDTTALFTTDFGVSFTLQICFDIGFEDPAYNNVRYGGIKDVITSTSWVDYMPFNTADFTQSAWSRGLKVNLLISGYHWPEKAKMGSGIYRYLFDEPPVYVYDKDSGNVLIVAEVKTTVETTEKPKTPKPKMEKKIQDKIIFLNTEEEERIHVVLHESLEDYSSVVLQSGEEGQVFTADVCNVDTFCCNLTYQYTGNLTYRLIALKGQFLVGSRYHIGAQNCAVLWCDGDEINSCGVIDRSGATDQFGPFTLSSSTFTIDSIFPSGGHRNLSLISKDTLHYAVNGDTYSVSSDQPISDLFYFFLIWKVV